MHVIKTSTEVNKAIKLCLNLNWLYSIRAIANDFYLLAYNKRNAIDFAGIGSCHAMHHTTLHNVTGRLYHDIE